MNFTEEEKEIFYMKMGQNIGFEQNNTSDLFHLDYHKHYEAISSFNFISLTKFGIEFQDSGLNTNINAKTNITNVCFLNLNI